MKSLENYISDNADIAEALGTIVAYGGIDGAHHKDWVLDQVVRSLTGGNYEQFVMDYEKPFIDSNGDEDYYEWDTGIAP